MQKKIGLIGGLSYLSSLEYYRIINEEIQKILGGHHSAEIVLYSLDFEPMVQAMFKEDWGFIRKQLSKAVLQLKNMDCSIIAVCCNSVHKVFHEVENDCDFELLHIIEPAMDLAHKLNFNKVGLLGTKFTMRGEFYKSYAEKNSIELIVPKKELHDKINEIIFSEICLNKLSEASERFLFDVLDDFSNRVEGVILACTELPKVINKQKTDVFLFSTTNLHAKEIALRASGSKIIRKKITHFNPIQQHLIVNM